MNPGDTVTIRDTHLLRANLTSFAHIPAISGPATILDSVGDMHRIAFHGWISEANGAQFLPWIHEDDLIPTDAQGSGRPT